MMIFKEIYENKGRLGSGNFDEVIKVFNKK